MTTSTEDVTTGLAKGGKPKPNHRGGRAPRRAAVAPVNAKPARKTDPTKKTPQARTKAKAVQADGAREGSKTAKILDLLKRPGGVTSTELLKATGWQPHSVRGFLSGTIAKKMGLTLTSVKSEEGERSYSVKA